MKKFGLVIVALAVLVPAAAKAQWTVGARTGYSKAAGDIGGDSTGTFAMSDFTSGQVPIQLDVGYRLQNTALTVGGYVSYGFGSVSGNLKTACDTFGQSCSSSSFRLGGQLLYSFGDAKQPADPWVGVGMGYDGLTLSGANDVTFSGAEFLVQGGVDWRLAPQFNLGAFASFSLGQYSSVSGSGAGTIPDKKMHEWLTIGLRGTFGFGS